MTAPHFFVLPARHAHPCVTLLPLAGAANLIPPDGQRRQLAAACVAACRELVCQQVGCMIPIWNDVPAFRNNLRRVRFVILIRHNFSTVVGVFSIHP